ncbi:hypothetical protein K493DRAFT_298331 [Basidiobolus meristosporus CBS 931.73]|uniref:Uncharacterized protein n=1 Tax=Basidiobolus meristosporus CBS 931.73 TaxID=1314790 RepID=A0A1Y1YU94_9FUNG|nr:hypothetical protein K493DRAFT_298331 [Basidiobolus meristosporus CBS 931.73]|eukprot:ORY01549.1 hypothetical protein K493DRAFT_298331 [Basidiobolus meristosporus CBS 931.73]
MSTNSDDLTTTEQQPEALWGQLYQLRKQRNHLNQRLKLFIRITILSGTAVLIAGVDPLNLQWWFALIPLILMIVNMVLIMVIRGRVRLLESEETHLLQKLRPFQIGSEVVTLSAPPPTYNIAAVDPPAYFNPMKAPSYTTLPGIGTSNHSTTNECIQLAGSNRPQTHILDLEPVHTLGKATRPYSCAT